MTKLLHSIQTHIFLAKAGFILLLLLLGSACQPAAVPATAVPLPSVAIAVDTFSTDTPEAAPLPTVTAAGPVSALSADGPWLTWRKPATNELAIVNADGTGRVASAAPDCNFNATFVLEASDANRMSILDGSVYVFQPLSPMRRLVYRAWPSCHTAFTGDAKSGLLAVITRAAKDPVPDLVIYEMPGGKIRSRLPLVRCPAMTSCDFSDVDWWQLQWSPNGRYLAFPAILDGASTDLYVYDSQDGSTRQLTTGPDRVAQFWWSPDGRWIVMGEVSQASGAQNPYTTSLFAVSVSTSDIHLLYSLDTPFPQNLLGWLDNEKFVVYDGPASFQDASGLPARNLRMIDVASDKIQLVFDGNFTTAQLEPTSQMIVLYGKHNGDQYQQGAYLLSIGAFTVKYLGSFQYEWNDFAKLFVTGVACKDDAAKTQAFDFSGAMQCAQLPLRPDLYPSPDGKWQVLLQDGVHLEAADKSLTPVSADPATQVIWCPDSTCFFYVANQALYRASLPDLTVQKIDEGLGADQIAAQWVGGK
ncbi:MAG: hypothetical protein WA821_11060 [Anaerolineales bacterium]